MAAPMRKRRFPIIGDGGGVWSHVQIEDAATATAIAVEHGEPGIYNVVDDDAAPVREWLSVLARSARRGEVAAAMMTEARGASNAKPSASSAGNSVIRTGGRDS